MTSEMLLHCHSNYSGGGYIYLSTIYSQFEEQGLIGKITK